MTDDTKMPRKGKKNYAKFSKTKVEDDPVEEVKEKVSEPEVKKDPEPTVEDVTVIAVVVPKKLNVRSEPAKADGNVICVINKDQRITVHTAYQNPTWAYVSVEAAKGVNVDGFVMKGFIKEVKEG